MKLTHVLQFFYIIVITKNYVLSIYNSFTGINKVFLNYKMIADFVQTPRIGMKYSNMLL